MASVALPPLTHWGRVTHICVGNLTIIGPDNGLSPGWRQAIIWTNAGILLIGPHGNKLQWNRNRNSYIFIEENAFQIVVLKMAAILSRPQCVNYLTTPAAGHFAVIGSAYRPDPTIGSGFYSSPWPIAVQESSRHEVTRNKVGKAMVWPTSILTLPNRVEASSSSNTLRPRQNGRHFANDIFKRIFLNEKLWIPIKISLKFVPKGSINNIPALVQIMAWRRPGDKPLSEPMMVQLLTYICITRPQWVKQ